MDNQLLRSCIMAVVIALAAGCGGPESGIATVQVRVGDVELEIPDEYVLSRILPVKRSDTNRTRILLGLLIDAEGPAPDPAYSATDFLAVSLSTELTRDAQALRIADGAPSASQDTEEPLVRLDARNGLARVYHNADYPRRWRFAEPVPGQARFEVRRWLAWCALGNSAPVEIGLERVTCTAEIPYRGLRARVLFAGARVMCLDKIIERVQTSLARWDRTSPGNKMTAQTRDAAL